MQNRASVLASGGTLIVQYEGKTYSIGYPPQDERRLSDALERMTLEVGSVHTLVSAYYTPDGQWLDRLLAAALAS